MTQSLVASIESLGRWLIEQSYSFITPTPASHQRVFSRSGSSPGASLRDVFGWSLPFDLANIDKKAAQFLRDADLLEVVGNQHRSSVRFSSVGDRLYAHSAFPTTKPDAIFFGPDTYRFVNLIANELSFEPLGEHSRILDVCCGAGPGGIEAAFASAGKTACVTFADINPVAIDFSIANARINKLNNACFVQSDLLDAVSGNFDFMVANPPYLVDPSNRVYRSGGGQLGAALSEKIVAQAITRLAPGGRLIVYTGVAIAGGIDLFLQNVRTLLDNVAMPFRYFELDPDVFGEELDTPAYSHVDRIAAVALVVKNIALARP